MKNRFIDPENKIRIRRDVPIPEMGATYSDKRMGNGRPTIYNVKELEVGDSFIYDKSLYNFKGHVGYWTLITGFRFVLRETTEGNRVWRVS